MKTVVLEGNCQAGIMARFLGLCPVLATEYEFKHVPNYGEATAEQRGQYNHWATTCAIWIEQVGTTRTTDYSGYLASHCRRIRIPVLICLSLWPLMAKDPRSKPELPAYPWGKFPYGDKLVIKLLSRLNDPDQVFQEYVNTDISSEVDFKMVHEMTLERFRRIESTCDFGVSDYYVEHIQNERLFHAVNHMSANLIEQLVQSISSCLASEAGLAGADLSEGQHNRHTAYVQQEPLGGVQLPIHPQVIEFFKLTWVKPDDSYKYFKQHLNWRNYLMKYIRYELD